MTHASRQLLPSLLAVLSLTLYAAGCRGASTGGSDDPDAAEPMPDSAVSDVDAAPQIGCDPYEPRLGTTSTFIGPSGLEARLLGMFDSAQDELFVMMYVSTQESFSDRLIAAHQRGVDVRVLLDGDHPGNGDARSSLMSAGVAVRDAPDSFVNAHSKLLLIDNRELVLMSSNLTFSSMNDERNHGVVLQDPEDVFDARAIFDSDWTGEGFPDLGCTRLVVSPINARQRLLDHINRAENTLELELLYLSDATIRNAVEQRHADGVAVRVLLNNDQDNRDTAMELDQMGVPARVLSTPDVHAKLIVADGVPLVGSHNMSFTSINSNREVGAMVLDPTAAATILATFESDWNSGFTP